MKPTPIRALAAVALVTIAVVAVVAALLLGGSTPPSPGPESMFQDDNHLLYADGATVARTLDVLKALGVNRIRLTIDWKYIAPAPSSPVEPPGFNATDPAAYAFKGVGGTPGVWAPYDRVVKMAAARGIGVDFDVTAPGPLWAMQPAPATTVTGTSPADHYEPSASDFGQFVQALGTRYSGTYIPPTTPPGPTSTLLPSLTPSAAGASARSRRPLPRVAFWSIWNEPNQPGWLAPQYRTAGSRSVPAAPMLYRALVRAAFAGLDATGHTPATDTILLGETAPEGSFTQVLVDGHERYVNSTAAESAIPPMVFLRGLYCVSSSYRRLTGAAASAVGCPRSGSPHAFVSANPGLFDATGFAHHPYFFLEPPTFRSPEPDYVPLADLGRLERGLDRAFAAYGVGRRIPIYLTEYGYQTNPPSPGQNVTPAEQAAYLNEAQYMAWRDPRVRAMAQFLLYDAGPNPAFAPSSYNYWGSTFQTGLIFGPGTPLDGRLKPSYRAYRLPIWIPDRGAGPGSPMLIWGQLRSAPKDTAQQALVQARPAHGRGFRTIATVDVPGNAIHGYFTTRVAAPGAGAIRIAWRSRAGHMLTSRAVTMVASVSSPAPSGGAFAAVQNAFAASPSQTLAPCQFSPAELAAAQGSIPNDDQQYDQNLVAAIEQARQEQADGACSATRPVASANASTTTPATPAPPPAPPLGRGVPLQIGSATAATASGPPVPVAILIVLGLLLAAPALVLGAVRLGGWDPRWAAGMRHSWSEAEYRITGAWSVFGDRIRRGR